MWAASSDRAPLTLALSLARGERAPSGAIRMTKLTFGYLYDFRNPAQWRRPWAELYADILDFAAHTEALGFDRSEEHTSELKSLMSLSYAVFFLKKKRQDRHSTQEP